MKYHMRLIALAVLCILPSTVSGQDIDIRLDAGTILPLRNAASPAHGQTMNQAEYVYWSGRERGSVLGLTLSGWFAERLGVVGTVSTARSDVRWHIPEQTIPLSSNATLYLEDRRGRSASTLIQLSVRGAARFQGPLSAEVSAGLQTAFYEGYLVEEANGSLMGPVVGVHTYVPVGGRVKVGVTGTYTAYQLNPQYQLQHDLSVTAGLTMLLSADKDGRLGK